MISESFLEFEEEFCYSLSQISPGERISETDLLRIVQICFPNLNLEESIVVRNDFCEALEDFGIEFQIHKSRPFSEIKASEMVEKCRSIKKKELLQYYHASWSPDMSSEVERFINAFSRRNPFKFITSPQSKSFSALIQAQNLEELTVHIIKTIVIFAEGMEHDNVLEDLEELFETIKETLNGSLQTCIRLFYLS